MIRPRSAQLGSSLVEVSIAIFLLSITVFGMTMLAAGVARWEQWTDARAALSDELSRQIEFHRGLPLATLRSTYPPNTPRPSFAPAVYSGYLAMVDPLSTNLPTITVTRRSIPFQVGGGSVDSLLIEGQCWVGGVQARMSAETLRLFEYEN